MEVSLLEYNRGSALIAENIRWLHERDFLLYDICDIYRRASDSAIYQLDVIFVRRDSPLRYRRDFQPENGNPAYT